MPPAQELKMRATSLPPIRLPRLAYLAALAIAPTQADVIPGHGELLGFQ